MTILPGSDSPEDQDRRQPPGSRLSSVDRRTAGLAAAVVVALVAGGGWWLLGRSSSPTAPAAAAHHPTAPAVHHPALPATGRLTRPAMRSAADTVFAVLPGQLPGWTSQGKTHFSSSTTTASDRKLARCAGAKQVPNTGVESADYVQNRHTLSGEVDFYANAAAARRDLATVSRPRFVRCMAATFATAGMPVDKGMRLEHVRVTRVPVHGVSALAFQIDGVLTGAGRPVPMRMDMLGTAVGRVQVAVVAVGFGEAVPVSGDVSVLKAMVAKARSLQT